MYHFFYASPILQKFMLGFLQNDKVQEISVNTTLRKRKFLWDFLTYNKGITFYKLFMDVPYSAAWQ